MELLLALATLTIIWALILNMFIIAKVAEPLERTASCAERAVEVAEDLRNHINGAS